MKEALEGAGTALSGALSAAVAGMGAGIDREALGLQARLTLAVGAGTAPLGRSAEAAAPVWNQVTRTAAVAWQGMQAGAHQAAHRIGASFEEAAATASSALGQAAPAAHLLWQQLAQGAGAAADAVGDRLKNLGAGMAEGLIAPLRNARDRIADVGGMSPKLLPDLGPSLTGALRNGLPDLLRASTQMSSRVGGVLSNALRQAGRRLPVALGQGIRSAARVPAEGLRQVLGPLKRPLGLPDLTDAGADFFGTLVQGVTAAARRSGASLDAAVGNLLAGVRTAWQGLLTRAAAIRRALTEPFFGIAEGMATAASALRAPVEGIASGPWTGLAGALAARVQEGIAGLGSVLRTQLSTLDRIGASAAPRFVGAFRDVPRRVGKVVETMGRFLAADSAFFQAGRRMAENLGQGLAAAAAYPLEQLQEALGRLRSLLPFSDAKAGPLAHLRAAGAAVLQTLAQGMARVRALPGTVLGQALGDLLGAVAEGWQRLGALSAAGATALAVPFQGLAGTASGAWRRVTSTAAASWRALQSMATKARAGMTAPFDTLAGAASTAWNRTKTAVSGAGDALVSKGAGLLRTAAESSRAVRGAAGGASAFLHKLATGLNEAATLPGPALARGLARIDEGMGRLAVPTMLTGTLALTPVVDEIPPAGAPLPGGEPNLSSAWVDASPDTSRRLAETRGALAATGTGPATGPEAENLRGILEALLERLDALAERPIDVSLTTLLDGRQVAQSVYRDLRERKVRNYETL